MFIVLVHSTDDRGLGRGDRSSPLKLLLDPNEKFLLLSTRFVLKTANDT
ncbi:MAG: hypothetical protein AB4042_21455 [Leptolyngbyaceae cyanobacterium]